MTTLVIAAACYAVCGVLAYGMAFAELQDGAPASAFDERWIDRFSAVVFAAIWPICGAFIVVATLRFRAYTEAESKAAYEAKYPHLSWEGRHRGRAIR